MRSRSSSSASASSLSADNVQILVKIAGGKTIPLNVRPSNSISDVLDFLSASANLPSDVRILLAGRHLPPSETVASLNLQPATTLELVSPLCGGTAPAEMSQTSTEDNGTSETVETVIPATDTSTPIAAVADAAAAAADTRTSSPTTTNPVRRKPRCAHPPCKALGQPITGDCGFCQKRFCSKHRMLESHKCKFLEDAKKMERDRNRQKLEEESTVMVRGI